jgi:hypothetical protein
MNVGAYCIRPVPPGRPFAVSFCRRVGAGLKPAPTTVRPCARFTGMGQCGAAFAAGTDTLGDRHNRRMQYAPTLTINH